jgi:hypothetical protein
MLHRGFVMYDFRRKFLEHQVESFTSLARQQERAGILPEGVIRSFAADGLAYWQAQLDGYLNDLMSQDGESRPATYATY